MFLRSSFVDSLDPTMFCPDCGLDHDETTPVSSEHIIPYAMGGSDEFTISVCEVSNNRLGGQVDRPVIEFFPSGRRDSSLDSRRRTERHRHSI
jgi:hypothetical protein